jgi:hypothetical protein
MIPPFIATSSSLSLLSRRTLADDRLRFTSNMQTFAGLIAAWFAFGFLVCRVCTSGLHRAAVDHLFNILVRRVSVINLFLISQIPALTLPSQY